MCRAKIVLVGLMLASLAACQAVTPSSNTPIPLANTLVLYDWMDDIPQEVLDSFTLEYGVEVIYEVYISQEEAIQNMRAGGEYDVVVMESRWIPMLLKEGLLADLNYTHLPNARNLSANFRDLAYDPDNAHSIPYSWGTTGLVVRTDLVAEPVTSWTVLWDPRYEGHVGIWGGLPNDVIALTLKSLGYSANSENPLELEAAAKRLTALRKQVVFFEDFDLASSAELLASGEVVVSMGYSYDALLGRERNPAIAYVFPQEGVLLWNDTFVIPANSKKQTTAETFLNYVLRPEVAAAIVNQNYYATANDAALEFVSTEVLENPIIFPQSENLRNAEVLLPPDPDRAVQLEEIWERFMGERPQ